MPVRLACLGLGLLLGLQAATQLFAWTYQWAAALGPAMRVHPDLALYPPWAILAWRGEFGDEARTAVSRSAPLILFGAASGLGLGALVSGDRTARRIRG